MGEKEGLTGILGIVSRQILATEKGGYPSNPEKAAKRCANDVAILKMFREAEGLQSNFLARQEEEVGTLGIEAWERLRDLEKYFTEAFAYCSDKEITLWSMARLPMNRVKLSDFGEVIERPYNFAEISRKFRRLDSRKIAEYVRKLDDLLYEVLIYYGEVNDGKGEI